MLKLSFAGPRLTQPRHNDALISDIKPLSQVWNISNENALEEFNFGNGITTPSFDGQMTILAADIKVAFNFLQFPWFQLFLAASRHEMEKQ